MILNFVISIIILISSMAASAASNIKPLSNDEILTLQAQRTIHRNALIEKSKSVVDPAANVSKSQSYYAAAIKNYEKGDFALSRKFFEAAISLNPTNDRLYFDYGKCLYRQGAYKMSLSVFLMLENSGFFEQQVGYYQGLNYYRLQNKELALRKFKAVKEDGSDLTSSSAFYMGLIYFQDSNYPLAKKQFEFVLDNSKDPKLDNLAEKYIDQIARQESVAATLDHRFGYTLNVGLLYDQNVLNISEQDAATSLKAYRLSYGGSFLYRGMNRVKEQLTPTFTFSDLYSVGTDFKGNSTIQGTDPLIIDFGVPYTANFTLSNKAAIFQIGPVIELIYMTKDTSKRDVIFNNLILSTSLTLAHSNYLTNVYKLNVSKEQSYINEVSPDDSQTAQKYFAQVSSYYLLNKENNETIFSDLSYTLNQAEGINSKYNKSLISLGYTRNISKLWSGYIKADYFKLNYPEAVSGRKDTAIIGYLGASYSLNPNDSVSFGLQYQNNQSAADSYKYNKFLASIIYSINRL